MRASNCWMFNGPVRRSLRLRRVSPASGRIGGLISLCPFGDGNGGAKQIVGARRRYAPLVYPGLKPGASEGFAEWYWVCCTVAFVVLSPRGFGTLSGIKTAFCYLTNVAPIMPITTSLECTSTVSDFNVLAGLSGISRILAAPPSIIRFE
jgi:hypothetical protein